MAEFRLQVPDALIQAMQEKMGAGTKMTDIAREALTMFNWALNEKAEGRVILSSDGSGSQLKQLAMASLDRVLGAAPAAPPAANLDKPTPVS